MQNLRSFGQVLQQLGGKKFPQNSQKLTKIDPIDFSRAWEIIIVFSNYVLMQTVSKPIKLLCIAVLS